MTGAAYRASAAVLVLCGARRSALLMTRSHKSPFMPQGVVFPGGKISDEDAQDTKRGALRELFEETGLLPVERGGKLVIRTAATDKRLADLQVGVHEQPALFGSVIEKGETLASSSLLEWTRWLTPVHYDQRFLTHFFVLRTAEELESRRCRKEASALAWHPVDDALSLSKAGRLALPPPQYYEMARLADFADWQKDVQKASPELAKLPVQCPQLLSTAGGRDTLALRGDVLYDEVDSESRPARELTPEELAKPGPRHRMSFAQEPKWADFKLENNLRKVAATTNNTKTV